MLPRLQREKTPAQKRQALNAAILGRLVEFVGDNELGARGVDELRSIMKFAEAKASVREIEIDPSLARGLVLLHRRDHGDQCQGSSGQSGWWWTLRQSGGHVSRATSVPACGFSLGLERIIVVMTEREMFPPQLGEFACGCDGQHLERRVGR